MLTHPATEKADGGGKQNAATDYGIGQLGKSVPEAIPFLWEIIYSRSAADRFQAFRSLQYIGFDASDIPMLAKLMANPASNQNILTKLVAERAWKHHKKLTLNALRAMTFTDRC